MAEKALSQRQDSVKTSHTDPDSGTEKTSGSGDVRGSLSIPKDLSDLGSDGTLNDKDNDKQSLPISDQILPMPDQAVPLALSESFNDPDPEVGDRSMDLSTIPEVSYDSPGASGDPDISSSSEQQPFLTKVKDLEKDTAKHRAKTGAQNHNKPGTVSKASQNNNNSDTSSPHSDKPAVEMILIDRSNSGKEASKKMLRIDEHMNVSLYKASGDGGRSNKAVIGVMIFCALVMITTLVVVMAGRNHVNSHDEVTSLVHSLDLSTRGSHPVHLPGWNVWRLVSPTLSNDNMTDTAMRSTDGGQTHTNYILLQENYKQVRFKLENDVIITYMAGCYIKVTFDLYKDHVHNNSSEVIIGSPLHHTPQQYPVLITYQYPGPPQAQDKYTVYAHFDIGFDGLRTYSLFSATAKPGSQGLHR